jgi:uncharacterized glyoxalase superfamily protein PhnB
MKLLAQTPMLEAENLRATIGFYTEILQFECVDILPNATNPTWAYLEKDGIGLMFTRRSEDAPTGKTSLTGSLYFHVADIEETWTQLKDKAEIEYPLQDFDYGMREFAIRDPNGYLLQFGNETEE